MSIKVISWVWSDAPVTNPIDTLVLLALADECNDEGGSCFPSLRRVASKARVAVSTVQAAVVRLEEQGLVDVCRSSRGRGRSNQYTVLVPWRESSTELSTTGQPSSTTPKSTAAGTFTAAKSTEKYGSFSTFTADKSTEKYGSFSTYPVPITKTPSLSVEVERALFESIHSALAGEGFVMDDVLTRDEAGTLRRVARDLEALGATPDEVHVRVRRAFETFSDPSFVTAKAIGKSWARLSVAAPTMQQSSRRTCNTHPDVALSYNLDRELRCAVCELEAKEQPRSNQ